MARVLVRFYDELNDFLPRQSRHATITHEFDWRASIKDMLESLGPPHCEIALLVVNGRSVGFDTIVQDGDEIHAYPLFDAVQLPEKVRLRPSLELPPRFVLDIHLGRLAAYLRMMGFDVVYGDTNDHKGDFADPALARIAGEQRRVMLTRDIGLLKRSVVTYGYRVRSTRPHEQLAEVVGRYGLAPYVQPFKRCMKCNGLLYPVEKAAIVHLLRSNTTRYVNDFHQCEACGQVYWKGLHTDRMQKLIDEVLAPYQADGGTD